MGWVGLASAQAWGLGLGEAGRVTVRRDVAVPRWGRQCGEPEATLEVAVAHHCCWMARVGVDCCLP